MDLPWSLQEASYLGFINDFASFIMKNIHPFNVYRSVSIYTQIVFANILVLMPAENFRLHYQSGFQLSPGEFGT